MGEWKKKLGESPIQIIDGDRGKNYPMQDDFLLEGYCLFLSTKNVRECGFDFSDCQFVSKDRDDAMRKGKLQRLDTVLTTRGTVGNVAFYGSNVAFENIRINSGMVILRPDQRYIDPRYCFYVFRDLQRDFSTYSTGSAQPQLPIRDLSQMEVLLPDLPEQHAIASVLSSLDDKIDLLHRQNKTLEALAETLFRQWFVEEATDKIPLGEVAEVGTGKGLRREKFIDVGGYPILGANGEIGRTNNYLTDERLILSGRVGTLGKVYISEGKVWISDNVLIIKPISDLYFYAIYFSLKSFDFENLNVGSTQPLVTQTDLKNIELLLPSYDVLRDYFSHCKGYFGKVSKNKDHIRTLTQIRDTLLPKLMSGEVRVRV